MRLIPLLGLAIACLLLAGVAAAVEHALGPSDAPDGAAAVGQDAARSSGDQPGVLAPYGGDGPDPVAAGGADGDARASASGQRGGAGTAAADDAGVGRATETTDRADPDLLARLDAVFRRHGPPGTFGLAVLDPEGQLVWGRRPDRALMPASTQKVVTGALALETLGADHRFTTEVRAAGPVADGVLHGDLIVVGGGDPALGDPMWERVLPARPRTPLEDLAARVADAGIREIRGQVVGWDPVLPWQPQASGWPPRYLASGDAVRSAGLTVNGGLKLREQSGHILGEPAQSPALETARTVAEQLRGHDVAIADEAGVIDEAPGDTRRVAAIDSPPVGHLLRFTLRRSDNHFADTLWRMAGTVNGDGSWSSAARAATAVLGELGIPDLARARFADGSGLSRDNRLTARQLALLDQRMTAAHGAQWDQLKALAAVRGTLRHSLFDTAAAGELSAKTGSLRDVRALVGSVEGVAGRWHLAMLANELDAADTRRFRRLREDLAVVLARDTQGCALSGCRE